MYLEYDADDWDHVTVSECYRGSEWAEFYRKDDPSYIIRVKLMDTIPAKARYTANPKMLETLKRLYGDTEMYSSAITLEHNGRKYKTIPVLYDPNSLRIEPIKIAMSKKKESNSVLQFNDNVVVRTDNAGNVFAVKTFDSVICRMVNDLITCKAGDRSFYEGNLKGLVDEEQWQD